MKKYLKFYIPSMLFVAIIAGIIARYLLPGVNPFVFSVAVMGIANLLSIFIADLLISERPTVNTKKG